MTSHLDWFLLYIPILQELSLYFIIAVLHNVFMFSHGNVSSLILSKGKTKVQWS